ncbi:MAG: EAL domain-containing protein [Alcanivoracaceae bacterium]|jgi:diguanylate cyclase (GGDEF)-like protein|nr:EAL domain-containing protein [Alcanivoracaceae bacterium]
MRHSHLGKLMLILVGLVCALQLASHLASRNVIRDTLIEDAGRELRIGADIFSELLGHHATQLTIPTRMLAMDDVFQQAVLADDSSSINEALTGLANLLKADLVLLSNGADRIISPTNKGMPKALPESRVTQVGYQIIAGQAYEIVMTPVFGTGQNHWLVVGYQLDEALVWHLSQLTSLDVSLLSTAGRELIASTLLPEHAKEAAGWLTGTRSISEPQQAKTADSAFLFLTVPLSSDISAILQLPMERVLAPYRALERQLIWLAIVALLFAALAAVLLARGISLPVTALANAARRITSGHYNTVVPVQSGDEFGELAKAFNAMQGAIAEREQRLVHQAEHDSLTGLPNRRVALLLLEDAIKDGSPFAVMALDLNRFKEINDALGHGVGDQVLGVVARRLGTNTKERDLAARLGADEFLLLLSGVDTAQAIRVAHRIRDRVAQTVELDDLHLNVEASIGIALFPEHGTNGETLMRRADIAMYDAKHAGHQVAVYQPGWDERHLRRLSLARDLKEALVNEDLHLLYQPKAALRDRERIGAEALIRWHHPTLGPLRPDEFIAIAEDAGHINRLTRWVLKAAVKQLQQWHREHLMVQLSVNISASDLQDEELPGFIATLLTNAEVEPQALCLEITESSVMKDEQQGHAMLARLKGIGLRLAVDDFGTGYSSLSQLKRMPVDELKIDKSFVLNLDHSDDDAVIVHSTIELGHNMGLEVVAEGVENRETVMLLESFGCDLIQGFLLGKPMSATELAVWARAWLEQPRIGEQSLSA